ENIRSIPLIAEVINRINPDTEGTPQLVMTITKTFSEEHAIPARDVRIKNIGTGIAKNLDMIIPQNYAVLMTTCPQNLHPNKECLVKILNVQYKTLSSPPGELILEVNNQSTEYENLNLLSGTQSPHQPNLAINLDKACVVESSSSDVI